MAKNRQWCRFSRVQGFQSGAHGEDSKRVDMVYRVFSRLFPMKTHQPTPETHAHTQTRGPCGACAGACGGLVDFAGRLRHFRGAEGSLGSEDLQPEVFRRSVTVRGAASVWCRHLPLCSAPQTPAADSAALCPPGHRTTTTQAPEGQRRHVQRTEPSRTEPEPHSCASMQHQLY